MRLQLSLHCVVCSGTGEGKYYMSLEHYCSEFKKKLGFLPYPGTLNLKLKSDEIFKLEILKKAKSIVISGFKEGNKYFGAVKCFKAKFRGISCWLIIPEKTRYKNIVEIISNEYLREKLKLKDG
ncbi:MAG: DUF120 domain-containing protein, partial [Candidatus Thermoplasmatota archaeon]